MPSAKSAIENYVIDRIDYGRVIVNPMMTVDTNKGLLSDVPPHEERSGWAYVESHSNTGSRYVVLASPLGSAASLTEGGEFLVTLLYPWPAAWIVNPMYLTAGYVGEKFANPVYKWQPADLVCVTRTIALALGVEDDADTAFEYLEKE